MLDWWKNLEVIQQVFTLIAVPATVIMIIQTVMLVIGMAQDADLDVDDVPDSADDGLTLFSVRGIVTMLAVTGWCAVAFIESGLNQILSVVISIVLGFLALVGMAYLMRAIYRLQASGNIDVGNAIGKVAQVYIPISGNAEKAGKVTLTLQEKYCELDAITTAEQTLRTGTYVRVVAVNEAGVLLVEPIAQSEKKEKKEGDAE